MKPLKNKRTTIYFKQLQPDNTVTVSILRDTAKGRFIATAKFSIDFINDMSDEILMSEAESIWRLQLIQHYKKKRNETT